MRALIRPLYNSHDPGLIAPLARANICVFGIFCPLKFIILSGLFAQIANTEPEADARSDSEG